MPALRKNYFHLRDGQLQGKLMHLGCQSEAKLQFCGSYVVRVTIHQTLKIEVFEKNNYRSGP